MAKGDGVQDGESRPGGTVLSRRQTLIASAWVTPAIMYVGSTKAFASSGVVAPQVSALRFTSQGASVQFGSNWGTVGEVQFWWSMENSLSNNPDRTTASITVTAGLRGGSSTPITVNYRVPAGGSYSNNTFMWVVPGYTPASNNTFFLTMSAPGFTSVTSAEFAVYMP